MKRTHDIDMKPVEGRKRVVIEEIRPQVDCGRHPARRVIGDKVDVSAAIFSDGHDHVLAQLLYKHESSPGWHVVAMTSLPNDMWTASFTVDKLGTWQFTLRGWVDHFDTWCDDLRKRLAAQAPQRDPEITTTSNPDAANPPAPGAAVTTPQDIAVALEIGSGLIAAAAGRASGADATELQEVAKSLQ